MPDQTTATILSRLRTLAMRDRDRSRLGGVHPYLAHKILRLLDAMEVFGFPMMIIEGLRTDEQQINRYAQGRTIPGPNARPDKPLGDIVSNADGIVNKSMHQKQDDGYGHAVDCAFIDDPETKLIETWDVNQPWEVYGLMGEKFRFTWGGHWMSLKDRPHLELSLKIPTSDLLWTPTDADAPI